MIVSFAAFLAAIMSLLFISNLLIYFPVIKAYKLNRKFRLLFLLILLALTFTLLGGEIARRYWNIYLFARIGYVWFGIMAISGTVMIINLIVYFAYRKIFRYSTSLALIFIIILSVVAIRNNIKPPRINEFDIYSEKISPETDGFRIVLVSEFHLMGDASKKWLDNIIAIINGLEPDLVLIAGDLIDDPYERVEHLVSSFRKLNPTAGTYSVPGNHDYYYDLNSYYYFTERGELSNLLNENVQITDDITLAGITDPTAKTRDLEPPDVEKALRNISPAQFIIFVSHQPLFSDEALDLGSDLILAGHTHGGQIPPLSLIIGVNFRYSYGLYEVNNRNIYTTSGVAVWGPPMRLFSQNEIVVFNLRSID